MMMGMHEFGKRGGNKMCKKGHKRLGNAKLPTKPNQTPNCNGGGGANADNDDDQ